MFGERQHRKKRARTWGLSRYAQRTALDDACVIELMEQVRGQAPLPRAIALKVLVANEPFARLELTETDLLRLILARATSEILALAEGTRDRPRHLGPVRAWLTEPVFPNTPSRLDLVCDQGVGFLGLEQWVMWRPGERADRVGQS